MVSGVEAGMRQPARRQQPAPCLTRQHSTGQTQSNSRADGCAFAGAFGTRLGAEIGQWIGHRRSDEKKG